MNRKELEAKLESQHKQILVYEKKLKDVVKAYKSLESEKNALQSVISSFEGSSTSTDAPKGSEPTSKEDELKTALATLSREKNVKEAALQQDKKRLLTENETLKERLKKAADEAEGQAEKMEKIVKDLSTKIKRIEADRERELTDHGNVLAEMQQRYAKEKQSAESAHNQMIELYRKLQDKESLPTQFKSKEKELQDQINVLNKELTEWKSKASRVPTVQLLQDQISNMKEDHVREIEEILQKSKNTNAIDKQTASRISELEDTTQRLTQRVADCERERSEAVEKCKKATEDSLELQQIIHTLEKTQISKVDSEDLVSQLKHLIQTMNSRNINFYDHIEPDPKVTKLQQKLDKTIDEYERYKIKAEVVFKSKEKPEEPNEDAGLRDLVSQLHDKLRNLEVSRSADQAQYELTARYMRERIAELERSEERCRNEMMSEMQAKIADMEAEMQKQRSRTLDILAEKERELEATKSILVSVRSEQLNNAPADPAQVSTKAKRKSSEGKRYIDRRISSGSRRSVDAVSVSSADFIGGSSDANNLSIPNGNESRNIFYEDELAKKDREVQEMRSSLHRLDYRLREVEQAGLCKDLAHHELAEKLKDEIRILEGKLKLVSDGGEMEYLRNIFVQYINCSTAPGAKNILKAIGMVLKLSPNEMKAIERKSV